MEIPSLGLQCLKIKESIEAPLCGRKGLFSEATVLGLKMAVGERGHEREGWLIGGRTRFRGERGQHEGDSSSRNQSTYGREADGLRPDVPTGAHRSGRKMQRSSSSITGS